jgi:hypothetical protein
LIWQQSVVRVGLTAWRQQSVVRVGLAAWRAILREGNAEQRRGHAPGLGGASQHRLQR